MTDGNEVHRFSFDLTMATQLTRPQLQRLGGRAKLFELHFSSVRVPQAQTDAGDELSVRAEHGLWGDHTGDYNWTLHRTATGIVHAIQSNGTADDLAAVHMSDPKTEPSLQSRTQSVG